jgi:NAD(P)-dependent dehydrogenase (short-subunit alcohol dehydrogenase family)
MPGEFAGKVAVITGGSRGIGREIAVDFAKAGAQTVIVSSSDTNLAAASQTIGAGRWAGNACDQRRPSQARRRPTGV